MGAAAAPEPFHHAPQKCTTAASIFQITSATPASSHNQPYRTGAAHLCSRYYQQQIMPRAAKPADQRSTNAARYLVRVAAAAAEGTPTDSIGQAKPDNRQRPSSTAAPPPLPAPQPNSNVFRRSCRHFHQRASQHGILFNPATQRPGHALNHAHNIHQRLAQRFPKVAESVLRARSTKQPLRRQ